ncbi:MAG: DNA polymerase III subunit delta [Bacilli bacterium]|nr:DNA polymerase III subunit delta [Bacilli bacterium]
MHNIYVFYGPEKLLIEEAIKQIIIKVFGNDDPNIVKYDMCEVTIKTIIDDACTLSLFSDQKIIIAQNSDFLTTSKNNFNELEINELIKYLNNYNKQVVIIFVVNTDKLDMRKKIVKELKQKAIVKEFKALKERELLNYARHKLQKNNYVINDKTLNLLISRVNYNLSFLVNELDKLMLYKDEEKVITEQDVKELTPASMFDNIFDLTNAVMNKDLTKILSIYQQLLTKGEEPIMMLVTLANQFRLIYQTKRLIKLGYSERDIIIKLKVHPYRIKLASQIKIDEEILLTYLEQLADLDLKIKTGQIDKKIGLELFFLQLNQK